MNQNNKQIIEKIESINWTIYNGSPWYDANQVPAVLIAFIELDGSQQIELYGETTKVLSTIGNDHAGSYYPAILGALSILIYAAHDYTNPVRCACALEMFIDIYCAFSADVTGYQKHTAVEIETFVNNQIYQLKDELEQKSKTPLPTQLMTSTTGLLDALIDMGPGYRKSLAYES